MLEEIKAQIVVELDEASLKNTWNEAKIFARDTKKELDKALLLKLQLDKASLKIELQDVKSQLTMAKKTWDQALAFRLTLKTDELQSKLTEAWRQLNNYKNTGEQDLSRLQAKFNSVNSSISDLWTWLKNVFSWNFKQWIQDMSSWISWIWASIWTALIWFIALQKVIWFFSSATSEAMKFEESLVRVKTVTEWTDKEYSQLAETIKKISNETWLASTKIADSAFFIASAWVALKDIPKTLELVSKASVATGSDTSIVFNWMSSVASIYWINLNNLSQISDLFFKANVEWKLTIEWLTSAIWTVAPIANIAWVSLKELTAWFATMVWNTGNADEVATQLKSSIQELAAPTATTTNEAKKFGIELWQQAIASKWYIWVLKEIYDKTGGNLEQIKKIIPDVRWLTAVTYLWSTGFKLYKENLDWLDNSLWETDKAFNKYSNSEVWNIKKAEESWNNWKISIWGFFISLFALLINSATYLKNWVQLWAMVIWEFWLAFITWFTFIWEFVWKALWFIVKNFWVFEKNWSAIFWNLVDNIWIVFSNIPAYIWKWLDKASWVLNSWINSAIWGINTVWDKLWLWKIWQANIKTNFWWNIQKTKSLWNLESFSSFSWDFTMTKNMTWIMWKWLDSINAKWKDLTWSIDKNTWSTKNNIWASTNSTKDIKTTITTLDWLNTKLQDLKTVLWKTDVNSQKFKDLQKEIKNTQNEIDKLDEWTKKDKKPKKWPSASSIEKKEIEKKQKQLEDEAKLEIEAVHKSKLTAVEKAEKILAINKKLAEDINNLKNDSLKNEVKNAEQVIKDYKKDDEENKKLYEQKKSREEKNQKILETGKWLVKDYYSTVRSELDKSKTKIDEYNDKINTSLEKWTELKKQEDALNNEKWQTLWNRYLEIEARKKSIWDELSKKNWSNTTLWDTANQYWKQTIDWLKSSWQQIANSPFSVDELSNALNLMEELKKLSSEQTLINQNADEKQLAEAKRVAELSPTAKYLEELKVKQKANADALEVERLRIKDLQESKNQEQLIYTNLDLYRTNLEKNFTSVIQGEITQRISSLELLRQKAIDTANAMAKAWVTTNINNNNDVNVTLQGTGYATKDAYNIWQVLTNQINLSAKWINK